MSVLVRCAEGEYLGRLTVDVQVMGMPITPPTLYRMMPKARLGVMMRLFGPP